MTDPWEALSWTRTHFAWFDGRLKGKAAVKYEFLGFPDYPVATAREAHYRALRIKEPK